MISFDRKHLDRLSLEHGFIRDNLEKEMRLTEILRHVHENKNLARCLVLKGGTAINLTVFRMPRLSVDIDLDFAIDCDREKMMEHRSIINNEMMQYMASEGYQLLPVSKNPHSLDSWVFGYQNAGGNKDVIKIEINYSNRSHVMTIEERHVTIDFLGDVVVNVMNPTELFASKINALISRTAIRDLYDVNNMIEAGLYVEQFRNGVYKPSLLFGDTELTDRVKQHPMALWKCRKE